MKTFKETIYAQGMKISVYTSDFENEFISLTDIARYRSSDPRITIHSWLRGRDVVDFLGLWECLHNQDFKRFEFDTFKKNAGSYKIHTDAIKDNLIPPELTIAQKSFVYADEADLLNVALFGKTAKEWRIENPRNTGNLRDNASISQLLILANIESYNAILIEQGVEQGVRLELLRQMVVKQLNTLSGFNAPLASLPQ